MWEGVSGGVCLRRHAPDNCRPVISSPQLRAAARRARRMGCSVGEVAVSSEVCARLRLNTPPCVSNSVDRSPNFRSPPKNPPTHITVGRLCKSYATMASATQDLADVATTRHVYAYRNLVVSTRCAGVRLRVRASGGGVPRHQSRGGGRDHAAATASTTLTRSRSFLCAGPGCRRHAAGGPRRCQGLCPCGDGHAAPPRLRAEIGAYDGHPATLCRVARPRPRILHTRLRTACSAPRPPAALLQLVVRRGRAGPRSLTPSPLRTHPSFSRRRWETASNPRSHFCRRRTS